MSHLESPLPIESTEAHRVALGVERAQAAARHGENERRARTRSRVLAAARLVVFAGVVVAALRAVDSRSGSLMVVALIAVFTAVVLVHGRVRRTHDAARRRRLLAEESARRLGGAVGPGAGSALPAQPVSPLDAGEAVYRPEGVADLLDAGALVDLGIDGPPPSLFRHLDTTQTLFGARRLRRMLRRPLLDREEIQLRQQCVAELARERSWRDELVAAFASARDAPLGRVPEFLAAPRQLRSRALRGAAIACAVGTPAAMVAAILAPAWIPAALGAAIASVVLHGAVARRSSPLRESYLEMEPLVHLAAAVAPALAGITPRSPLLTALRDEILAWMTGGAGARVPRVRRAMHFLHLHELGALYPPIEILTAWELNALCVLEDAVKQDGATWERVAGALSDLEALCALAVDADERQPGPWPEIAAGPPALVIESGIHPLLDPARAVANDVRLGGDRRLALVTGSNMSGKSTFLRTAALNVVLAQAGAAPRAARMSLTPLRLRALISVRDSLADGKSYFLVEVERVRDLLRLAATEPYVLGIIDELFRGTNSVERVAASRAIARHLAGTGGLFVIATHDHELTRLAADERVSGVVAWHFAEEIDSGELRFSYHRRDGSSTAHNALRLLEMAGYPDELVRAAKAEARLRWGEPGLD